MVGRLKGAQSRYPEKSLQLAAVAWLSENLGFEEVFGDVEALGARFDSAGFIGPKPVLIEFKTNVPESMIAHRDDRSMSIESKIAGCLGALYGGADDQLSKAVNHRWTRAEPPLVAVASNSFSRPGLAALQTLFEARSRDWAFDYAAFRWTGSEVETVLEGRCVRPEALDYSQLTLPKLIGRSARAPTRTVAELGELASRCGFAPLLDAFVAIATDEGFRLRTTRWGVGAHKGSEVICAIYLEDPPHLDGLDIGLLGDYWRTDAPLPGIPTQPVGYLNTNRRITTPEHCRQLFAGLRSAVEHQSI